MSRSHSFSVTVATSYGVDMALMMNHFSFWYLKNAADRMNYYKGDYWVRMKAATLRSYYPYFTERQLRYLIDKLIDSRLLKQDEFNDKKNDRTKWYCLTNKSKILLDISTDKNVSNIKKTAHKASIISTDKNVSNVNDKIVSLTDKNVTSIYKEVDIKDRYSIYIDFAAIIFIIKQDEAAFQVFEMQHKKSINNYLEFLKYFEIKVQEEEIDFTVNKLLGRLKRLAFNWNSSSSKNGFSNTENGPKITAKRLN
tara:strand:+ start:3415 stop:4173 length:759 start_codon:yes stop_codon:yes gene_type:complete